MSLSGGELMVLQAQGQMALRSSIGEGPVDEENALASVRGAYQQLQDLRLTIVQDMGQLERGFRLYHCIIYRELIVQALRQRVVRVEQLVELSRRTILQKTIRSGGDSDFSARMVEEQAERYGGRIQVILDRMIYPSAPIDQRDLVRQEG